ncbi:hypothetical protein BH18ACT15_BH18ACT15_12760 [soil metagenome]
MSPLRVAVVSRDEHVRLEAARAFDSAPPEWLVGLYKDPPKDDDVVVFGSDVPSATGIVFDPEQPGGVLEAVRRAAQTNHGGGHILVVTSCNRGAGVTTLGLHMARSLAARRKVCYVDLDTEWSAAPRLGLDRNALITWGEVDDGPEAVWRCALPVEHGFRILVAPLGHGAEEGVAIVARAAARFEVLVVDAPWSPAVSELMDLASAAVLVLPPTRPAALRARTLLLGEAGEKSWAVVTNRLGRGSELRQKEIERLIERPIALALPHAPRLRDAEDEGRLLSPTLSRWGRRVDRLAGAVERAVKSPAIGSASAQETTIGSASAQER